MIQSNDTNNECWYCIQGIALTSATPEWTVHRILYAVLFKWNKNRCLNYRYSCCYSSTSWSVCLCENKFYWPAVGLSCLIKFFANEQSIKSTVNPNYLKYFQVIRLKSKWSHESVVLKFRLSCLSSWVQSHSICDWSPHLWLSLPLQAYRITDNFLETCANAKGLL